MLGGGGITLNLDVCVNISIIPNMYQPYFLDLNENTKPDKRQTNGVKSYLVVTRKLSTVYYCLTRIKNFANMDI